MTSKPFTDMTLNELGGLMKTSARSTWWRMNKRMKLAAVASIICIFCFIFARPLKSAAPPMPSISFEYQGVGPKSPFNESKVALLIENRPNPILAPLMLHFMSVVPPDWRFRFMGSEDSVAMVNNSMAIRKAVEIGKLDLTYIPSNMSTAGQEMISRFLTNLWLYETVLQPAEWLLVYQTDSILCANSKQSLNDFLEYDWVGAPWDPNGRYGGNGGLSLRRVSAIVDVLRNQVRIDDTDPEDVWLSERLGNRPNGRVANGTRSMVFSGELNSGKEEKVGSATWYKKPGSSDDDWVKGVDDWRNGFYEPMGYHTGGSGLWLHSGIWGKPEQRQHIWNYCPEIKITLEMDAVQYVPGNCYTHWKRELDEDGYPMLPDNLVPF